MSVAAVPAPAVEWVVESLTAVCEPADAHWLVKLFLRTVGFFPYQVAGFSACVSMFDSSALVTFVSYSLLLAAFFYFHFLAAELQFDRAAGFPSQKCAASIHALPDAPFVTSVAYVVAMWVSVARHRVFAIKVSPFRAATVATYVIAYAASTVISGYFTPGLLAVNFCIAVALGFFCVLVYEALERKLWSHASRTARRRIAFVARLLGVTETRS